MSATEMSRSHAAGGMGNVVERFVAFLSSWQEARMTRRELGRLSDRELDDIGLSRGDIERVARGL